MEQTAMRVSPLESALVPQQGTSLSCAAQKCAAQKCTAREEKLCSTAQSRRAAGRVWHTHVLHFLHFGDGQLTYVHQALGFNAQHRTGRKEAHTHTRPEGLRFRTTGGAQWAAVRMFQACR